MICINEIQNAIKDKQKKERWAQGKHQRVGRWRAWSLEDGFASGITNEGVERSEPRVESTTAEG